MADNTDINPNSDTGLTNFNIPAPYSGPIFGVPAPINPNSDSEIAAQFPGVNQVVTLPTAPQPNPVPSANVFSTPNYGAISGVPATINPNSDTGLPGVNAVVDLPGAGGGAPEIDPITNYNGSTAGAINATRASAPAQTTAQSRQQGDWRVRLSLASGATYLYNDAKETDILYPLRSTGGIVFPYTPQIQTSYRANYDPSDLPHSNYKQWFYKNSSVEELTITADFTAQDTTEALYLLSVIHFFKSVTKMFYGKDGKTCGPPAGTPPPLCYLFGYGQYQYSDHPLLVNSFSYTLPTDVDYIRAGSTSQWPGTNLASYNPKTAATKSTSWKERLTSVLRLSSSGLSRGGITQETTWNYLSNSNVTYVPTKMQLTISCLPIVTRYDISNNFSLQEYATGSLLKDKGIW